jgi:hypothetical protein
MPDMLVRLFDLPEVAPLVGFLPRKALSSAVKCLTRSMPASAGYAYAIIGGAGPTAFYAKTVGAVAIEGSTPGIYRDPLGKRDANKS